MLLLQEQTGHCVLCPVDLIAEQGGDAGVDVVLVEGDEVRYVVIEGPADHAQVQHILLALNAQMLQAPVCLQHTKSVKIPKQTLGTEVSETFLS